MELFFEIWIFSFSNSFIVWEEILRRENDMPLHHNVIFAHIYIYPKMWVVGSGDGAGLLAVPGRPTTLAYGRVRACYACSRCGMDGLCFICFNLVYPIFLF